MRPLFLSSLIFSIMLLGCSGSSSENKIIVDLDELFTSLYPSNEPGCAFLIMKGDTILFEKGYGIADMESMTPIDPNTFFNIASVSKQFSAVALKILEQDGKLSLDDNVKKWFPEFESPLMEKITLRNLLSHTSGIPDSRDREDRLFVTTATDVESYSYISKLDKLNFEPGSSYEYMNPTYQLMYTIIERASGIDFESFMRSRIFDVAGMEKTLYFEEGRDIPNMAHGYLENPEKKSFDEYDYGEESFFATKADGGIYTSVKEFVKWELALRGDQILTKSSKDELFSKHITIPEIPYTSYGYGWFIEDRPDYPTKIYHTGDNGGFHIYAARYPQQEILYLFFSNRNDRDREKTAKEIDELLKREGWI